MHWLSNVFHKHHIHAFYVAFSKIKSNQNKNNDNDLSLENRKGDVERF